MTSTNSRFKSRLTVYVETLFVIFPLLLLFIVSFLIKDFSLIVETDEWYMGSIILSGQTLIRFTMGLIKSNKPGRPINKNMAVFWLSLLVFQIIFSSVFYILWLLQDSGIKGVILQFVMFLLALTTFIIFGGIGQIHIDKN